jgi:hypothetical protein
MSWCMNAHMFIDHKLFIFVLVVVIQSFVLLDVAA